MYKPYASLVLMSLLLYLSTGVGKTQKRLFYIERASILYKNLTVGDAYCNPIKLNRTTFAMSFNMTVFKALPPETMIEGILFKNDNGVYKPTALRGEKNLCAALAQEYQTVWAKELKSGALKHFIQKCPITPGFYHFDKMSLPLDMPYIPAWRCMFRITIYLKTAKFLVHETYLGVQTYFA